MSEPNAVTTNRLTARTGEVLRVSINGQNFDLPFKHLGEKHVAFLDISGNFRLIELCADNIVAQLLRNKIQFDTILNPVSKGNALAHAIAVRWTAKDSALDRTIVARKGAAHDGKNQASYRSVTTPAQQTLSLTADDAAFLKNKRILIVDDVFGGGGTFAALQKLADDAGATVAARAVIAVEEGAPAPGGLISLFILPTI